MNLSRKRLFATLSAPLFRSIESATAFAKLRGNPYVEPAHWLHQMWQVPGNDLHCLVLHYGIDPAQLERDLQVALDRLPNGASTVSDFSHHIELAIEKAWFISSLHLRQGTIGGAALVAAMATDKGLRSVLLHASASLSAIPASLSAQELQVAIKGSNELAQQISQLQHVDGAALPIETDLSEPDESALVTYCTDLTALAAAGEIDPVVGRDVEICNMVNILLRRRQNNPLLTGEAGVGKTAVVEGLALALAQGKVPPALQRCRLLSLDVGALVAGASMRGEFESRLKAVLNESAKSAQPIILFVDEVHTLVGAGGQAGTGDAANLLKPALARGSLRTIGATTWSEYKRHIEKDPALTRRFQVLQIPEPQAEPAMAMVRGLVSAFKDHHRVVILDEAVRAAVLLSQRYIPSRQLPDKAISLLDTACARVAMSSHTAPREVTALTEQIAGLRQERTMLCNDAQLGFEQQGALERLDAAVAHAEAALEQVTERWRSELTSSQRIAQLRTTQLLGAEQFSELHELEQQRPAGREALVHLQVDAHVIASIVADWTGIPVGRMVQNELQAILDLPRAMRARVIGQDGAIARIGERLRTSRVGLADPNKPVGVFLLVGPSGVGKTETALGLAQTFYGGEHNLITINMSEFQEAHTVSGLKGAPPGYVGFGEGGVLTEAVRRRPYSVVLLDEVEKAHPDVHEMFYQVFDKGWMEDGEGRRIDFRNTLILLTSNIGSELITEACDDPALLPELHTLADALQPELRKFFPVAFLGRVTTVPYLSLDIDTLKSIVALQLGKISERFSEMHEARLTWSTDVLDHIVLRCGTHEIGARRIGQFIERNVLGALSDLWLQSLQAEQRLDGVAISVSEQTAHLDADVAIARDGLSFYPDFVSAVSKQSRARRMSN